MDQLDRLLDTLREAKRYAAERRSADGSRFVPADPDESSRLAHSAMATIAFLVPGVVGDRLVANLAVGARFIRVAPDVFRGYIDGAILEIQDYASKEDE